MRITKLHLLLLFALVGISFFGFKLWRTRQADLEEKNRIELARRKQMEEEAAKKLAEAPPAPPAAEEIKKNPAEVSYTVQKGDTLWSIAKKNEHFGSGHRWYDIWKANEDSVSDFDRIHEGQVLKIPLDKEDGYAWPPTAPENKAKILRLETKTPETAPTN